MLLFRTQSCGALLTEICRTMAWAIDLDDTHGTAIGNLGKGMKRKKTEVYTGSQLWNISDLGT